jgi:hypothetical protein
MSKVVRVLNSNYKVAVQDGGTITLDTGVENGTTIVTGDLEVRGVTTTVESNDVTIKDNIIRLNVPEDPLTAPSGIPASLDYRGGVEIDRGQLVDARVVFDEQISWTLGGDSGTGTFVFEAGTQVLPIKTTGIVAGGTLYVSTGAGVISVTGTTDYEEKIFTYDGSGNILGSIVDDDNIPNTKAVADYVDYVLANTFQSRIEEDDTYVEALDFAETGNPSLVQIGVDNTPVAEFYADRFETGNLRFQNNTITLFSSNEDLVLDSPGTGTVKIKDVLEMSPIPWTDDATTDPLAPAAGIKLYTLSSADSSGFQEQTPGNTGIYFVNSNENRDEIISKNRALLYSMLF